MSVLDDILNRKLTRKEFLTTIALSGVSLLGVSSVAGILSGKTSLKTADKGFGLGLYGGDELLHNKPVNEADTYK